MQLLSRPGPLMLSQALRTCGDECSEHASSSANVRIATHGKGTPSGPSFSQSSPVRTGPGWTEHALLATGLVIASVTAATAHGFSPHRVAALAPCKRFSLLWLLGLTVHSSILVEYCGLRLYLRGYQSERLSRQAAFDLPIWLKVCRRGQSSRK